MGKLVLIDGHSILNRAFYGVPELTNSKGLHTNAVYGFLNIMFRVIEDEGADYLAVAFDLKEPTFRHKMYAAYKGTRKPMPQELHEQVPVMKEVLTAMACRFLPRRGMRQTIFWERSRNAVRRRAWRFLSYQEIVTCCSLQIRTLRFGCRVLRKVRRRYATITRRM